MSSEQSRYVLCKHCFSETKWSIHISNEADTLRSNPQKGESVAKYLAELRALAEFCNYGASLEDMLHDRLVCGIEDPPVQRHLLAEEHLTFKKSADTAPAMETAAKNAETLQRPTTSRTVDAHKSSLNKLQAGGKGPLRKQSSSSCYRHGNTSHMAAQCPYKEVKCHACGKMGHLKKVCRTKLLKKP